MDNGDVSHVATKIIFLDIDGVLNYHKCRWFIDQKTWKSYLLPKGEIGGDFYGIVPEKVEILKRIINTTGAKLVLSSTWRKHENWLQIMNLNGLEPYWFIGRTPDHVAVGKPDFRGAEVNEMLQTLADSGISVTKFAIIDDDVDFDADQRRHNLFRTTMREGLIDTVANAVIRHLGPKL